jgi:hypothetical protein
VVGGFTAVMLERISETLVFWRSLPAVRSTIPFVSAAEKAATEGAAAAWFRSSLQSHFRRGRNGRAGLSRLEEPLDWALGLARGLGQGPWGRVRLAQIRECIA